MNRGQRTAKNVLVTIGTQLIVWTLTFAINIFLPRYVGSNGLGQIAIATAFVSVFDVFISLGTSTILVKDVAREPDRIREFLASALALRVPTAAFFAGLAALASLFFPYPLLTRELIWVMAAGIIVSNTNDVLAALLQGQENLARAGVAALIEKITSATIVLTLIFRHAPVPVIISAYVVSGLIAVGVNLSAFGEHLPRLQTPRPQNLVNLARAGLPFLGWNVFRTLYGQTDPLILGFIASSTTAGWYAFGSRVIGMTVFFPAAITAALLPVMSTMHAQSDREGFNRTARQLLTLCLLLAVPIALVLVFLPERLLALLHYPGDFVGSIPVLRVASISVLLYFIAMPIGTTVIASDGQKTMLRVSIWGVVVGLPACAVGSYLGAHIPALGNAAVGATASDVVLETFLITLYLRSLPVDTFGRSPALLCLRFVLAGLPMALLLSRPVVHVLGLLSVVPAFAAYAAACVLFGCVDRETMTMVRAAISRRRNRDRNAVESLPPLPLTGEETS